MINKNVLFVYAYFYSVQSIWTPFNVFWHYGHPAHKIFVYMCASESLMHAIITHIDNCCVNIGSALIVIAKCYCVLFNMKSTLRIPWAILISVAAAVAILAFIVLIIARKTA